MRHSSTPLLTFLLNGRPTRLQIGDTLVLRGNNKTPTFYRGTVPLEQRGPTLEAMLIPAVEGARPSEKEEARMMRQLAWLVLSDTGLRSPLRMIKPEHNGDEHRFTILPTPEGVRHFYEAHRSTYLPHAAFEKQLHNVERNLRCYLRSIFYGPMTATLIFYSEVLSDPFAAYQEEEPKIHSSQLAQGMQIQEMMDQPAFKSARRTYEQLEEELRISLNMTTSIN